MCCGVVLERGSALVLPVFFISFFFAFTIKHQQPYTLQLGCFKVYQAHFVAGGLLHKENPIILELTKNNGTLSKADQRVGEKKCFNLFIKEF